MDKNILSDLALNPANKNKKEECCDVDHSQHEEFAEKTDSWDKMGIFLSGVCTIHCLVTPLLALALPALGEAFEAEWVHILMALFILPVGLFAFWSGYKHHKQMRVLGLGIAGLAVIVAALLLPHEIVDQVGHHTPTIIGSMLLITAHILNRRACLCHQHGVKTA